MAEYGEELSERELDVLRGIARGASNKEVAAELHISENTVKVHLRRVFAKLGVSSRTEATRVAIQLGLVIVPGVEIETVTAAEPAEADKEAGPPVETVTHPDSEATAVPAPTKTPRIIPVWRTVSLVLAVLLIVVIIRFINLQWQTNRPAATDPFVQTPLDEDWAVTNRPLPVGLTDMAVATIGLNVYAIGGETAVGTVNTIYSFDAIAHLWQERTPKPTAVTAATAAELFGEIYVVGGQTSNGQPTSTVEAYSPTQNAWRPVTALPQPISGGVALSDGSFLYLFGGWNGSDYLDTTYIYDPGADSWRPLATMSQPRALATGQFMTSKLYIVGGFDGEKALDICDYYDPTLSQWFSCPPLLLPRGGSASAVILNKLYVIGGGLNEAQPVTYSEWYDPTTETWQVVNTPLLNETPAWAGLGAANVENRIFVFGGRRHDTLAQETYIYSPFVYRTFLPNVSVDRD